MRNSRNLAVSAELAEVLVRLTQTHKSGPILVAIDGLAGAGKSTLARTLAAAVGGGSVVTLDDFYRPFLEEHRTLSPEALYAHCIEWPRLIETVLTPLRAGQPAHYHRRDWHTDQLLEPRTCSSEGWVFIEGVFALAPELRDFYDAALFVETPNAVRTARIRGRGDYDDLLWLSPWQAMEDWYLAHHRPQQAATLRIAGI